MSEKIKGVLRCEYCSAASHHRVSIGNIEGEPLTIGIVLCDVIGEERDFFVLDCGHRSSKLMPMLSNQEWVTLQDGTVLAGAHFPLVELKAGRL